MKTIKGHPKAYKILECLSQNQNSKVFKVLCIDNILGISEVVVLKILQSKNPFQDCISELESLKLVKSPHCVAVYNWEKLEGCPTLVLEYIDGFSLKELVAHQYLNSMATDYLIHEIHEGLLSLKAAGLSHGDLSPSNVMIDFSGNVKLIDYGMGNMCGRYTPSFTSPETLAKGEYSYSADLFSLGKLAQFMGKRGPLINELTQFNPEKRAYKFQLKSAKGRSALTKMVTSARARKREVKTQIKSREKTRFHFSWMASAWLAISINSSGDQPLHNRLGDRLGDRVNDSLLSVKTKYWAEIKVNNKILGYSPFFNKKVPSGQIVLEWISAKGVRSRTLTVQPGEHKIISDLDN